MEKKNTKDGTLTTGASTTLPPMCSKWLHRQKNDLRDFHGIVNLVARNLRERKVITSTKELFTPNIRRVLALGAISELSIKEGLEDIWSENTSRESMIALKSVVRFVAKDLKPKVV